MLYVYVFVNRKYTCIYVIIYKNATARVSKNVHVYIYKKLAY